jgi:flavodoxin
MMRILIFYHSRSGNTEKVVHLAVECEGGERKIDIKSKKVKDTNLYELLEAD